MSPSVSPKYEVCLERFGAVGLMEMEEKGVDLDLDEACEMIAAHLRTLCPLDRVSMSLERVQ